MTRPDFQSPHRRFDPLRGRWVLVSPHRTARPWQGETGAAGATPAVHYDPACYLCPGNARAGGQNNPPYENVFAFDNDFAALLPETSSMANGHPLLRAESERGRCRVLCFHPDHSLTLARMRPEQIVPIVDAWTEESRTLASLPYIRYVQIFENRGAMMGASNPHPHCQIWATEHLPDEPAAELVTQKAYLAELGECLLCGYLRLELERRERIVCENAEFVAVVPFWAVWPFETLLLSRAHLGSLEEMSGAQRTALAGILHQLTVRYDNLFTTDFPYTMGFHPRPAGRQEHPEWHFHGHFYPPLLRSAAVRKFMVGFEMLGMPQRDITPEDAAARLRGQHERHWSRPAE